MNILTISKSRFASKLSFSEDKMTVHLEDGRELSVPLAWFPKLLNASKAQIENWRFIGNGEGIHWEDLDEDISIERLLD